MMIEELSVLPSSKSPTPLKSKTYLMRLSCTFTSLFLARLGILTVHLNLNPAGSTNGQNLQIVSEVLQDKKFRKLGQGAARISKHGTQTGSSLKNENSRCGLEVFLLTCAFLEGYRWKILASTYINHVLMNFGQNNRSLHSSHRGFSKKESSKSMHRNYIPTRNPGNFKNALFWLQNQLLGTS